jgi:hypothetical protein
MSEPALAEVVSDALSEITRKERRNLLAASVVAIAASQLGLVPTKVAALGIELNPPAQQAFLLLLCSVVVYFLLAFLVYSAGDFVAWRKKYDDHLKAVDDALENESIEESIAEAARTRRRPQAKWLYSAYKPIAWIRISFDLVLPVVLGLVACTLVVRSL